MKRNIWLWQITGYAVTSLLGTLLHFLYEQSGGSLLAAPFSGVNESTFEHMKLLFWPMLAFAAIQDFFFREYESFRCIKLRGMLLGLISIPVIFYTYNGVIGKSPDWINIAIFFISGAIAYLYEAFKLKENTLTCKNRKIPIAIICAIALLFVIFTFATPEIEIFKDPLTNSYGIQ